MCGEADSEMQYVILILGYVLSFIMAWCLGANDASNPTETAVGSGVITIRKALILFSIFTALGALIQGRMVMVTLDRGIVKEIDVLSATTAVVSASIWITTASYLGLPISTTHSIIGSVLGTGLAMIAADKLEPYSLKLNVIVKIIISWITSPLAGIGLTIVLNRAISVVLNKFKQDVVDKILKYGLIVSLCYSAYAFGANDVGNATGVYITLTSRIFGLPDDKTMILLSAIGAIGIALGGLTIGKRVIVRVAYRITRLNPVTGFTAELSNALIVWLYTTIPYILVGYGMPISTTYVSVATVIGSGLSLNGWRSINWREVLIIMLSWIITLPATIALGLSIRYVLFLTTGF